MANELKMGCINALLLLHERGRSFRQIAAELGIHRETVARHVRLSREGPPKPAKVTTRSKRARSLCEEHREEIKEKLETGLSEIRIHQDLVEERGFRGGYESVKRFVRALKASDPLPFRRMEVLPGAEGQVDFGQGAFVDRGELYPLPGYLGTDSEVFKQKFHLDLPDGEYEFQVLPLGTAWIEEGGKKIRIEGDTLHSFGLLANPDRCALKITGPTGYALPVTVAPLALLGEMEPEPGIQFLGPYRWHETHYSIPRLQEARRLVALGRMSSWISKEIVRVDTQEARANFVPATRVEVRWAQGLEFEDRSVIVEVTSAFETRRAHLRPRLRAGSGRDGRTLVAAFVVPRGSMTVLLRTSRGRVLWTQTLQARRPNQVLEVRTP